MLIAVEVDLFAGCCLPCGPGGCHLGVLLMAREVSMLDHGRLESESLFCNKKKGTQNSLYMHSFNSFVFYKPFWICVFVLRVV